VLFVALIAFSVFLVVSIFFGVERGFKSAHAVSSAVGTAIGTIIILAAVFIYFGMWFFGLGCALFDWCPLRNHFAN
jgi:hypothetical protein